MTDLLKLIAADPNVAPELREAMRIGPPLPAKPAVDPYHLERITKRLQTLERRIAEARDYCEDRMDIDGNGNPDGYMHVAQILGGDYDR